MFTIFVLDHGSRYAFCMLLECFLRLPIAKVGENGRFVLCCGKMCQKLV